MSLLRALKDADSCFDVEVALVSAICEVVNTPHSIGVLTLIRYHEWEQLKVFSPDPSNYLVGPSFEVMNYTKHRYASLFPGIGTFRGDRLVSRMLVKSNELPTGIDTARVALDLFEDIEEQLELRANVPPPWEPWFHELKVEIESTLTNGEDRNFLTKEVLGEIYSLCDMGPGSSQDVKGKVPSEKLRQKSSVTPLLAEFACVLKSGQWLDNQPDVVISRFSEVITVPKTAWIDRTVSSVPSLNMFLQKGLGKYLQRLLKRNGVDISDQEKNRSLAKAAYDKKLATVDLSSASSWFTAHSMQNILPPDLLHMLDLVRPHAWLKSVDCGPPQPKVFHNLTPMGCGYTFPLMTLIFWCLVKTIVPKGELSLCGVYGDDIIIPQKYAHILVDRLCSLGVQVNREKSFLSGSFFESCGTEWFAGRDVLPFYCRKGEGLYAGPVITGPRVVPYRIQLANRLRRWASRPYDFDRTPKMWKGIWESLIHRVPKDQRPPVPLSFGDVGLTVSLEESKLELSKKHLADGWEQVYRIKYLKFASDQICYDDCFAYLMWLMRHTNDEYFNIRGQVSFYRAYNPLSKQSHLELRRLKMNQPLFSNWWENPSWETLTLKVLGGSPTSSFLHTTNNTLFTKGYESPRGSTGSTRISSTIARWTRGLEWA